MNCSPPGSSVHWITQTRIPKWAAISSPGDIPDPGTKPMSPALAGGFFNSEPSEKPRKGYAVYWLGAEPRPPHSR